MSDTAAMLSRVAPESASMSVCVVTVTYGNRWHLLSQVIAAVGRLPQVRRIVVVDNGAEYDLEQRLAEAGESRAMVAGSGRNEGSARGFALGLKAARQESDCDYIWILDDDNLPAPDALDQLCRAYDALSVERGPEELALMALRTDRQYLMRIAAGADPRRVFARPNSFLDFHILDAPFRVFRKLFGRSIETSVTTTGPIAIPYGVYGGLYFHRRLLDRVGYPDERFYLYGDDTEFTSRMSAQNGSLYLIPASTVDDLDTSWQVAGKSKSAGRLGSTREAAGFRVYYSTRNGAYLSSRGNSHSGFVWNMNRLVYQGILGVYLASHGRYDRFRLIRRAIRDADSDILGYVKGLEA